jgi:hypothetical protein
MVKGAPTIRVEVDGPLRHFIVDTGSSISLIQPDISAIVIREATLAPTGVTGAQLRLEGEQVVEFNLHGHTFRHPFHVYPLPTEGNGLVGTDLLIRLKARLDLAALTFKVEQGAEWPEVKKRDSGAQPLAFTVFEGLEAPSRPSV